MRDYTFINMTSKKDTTKKKPAEKKSAKIESSPYPATISQDEHILFTKMKHGNMAARNEILSKYSPWATNIARKYHSLFPNIDVLELEAEGNRGLLEALDKFDPSKHTKFSTYSWFWIIKNIQEYITSSVNLIGVPAKIMADLKQVINAVNNGMKKGEAPSLKAISRKLGLDEDSVNEMLSDKKNISAPLSLDMYIDEEDRQEKFGDMVEDKKLDGIKKILDGMDDDKLISRLLEQLSPLEQKVISLRYGFNGGRMLALNKIGEILKVSPSKIKDIEAIVLIKLKRLAAAFHKESEDEDDKS